MKQRKVDEVVCVILLIKAIAILTIFWATGCSGHAYEFKIGFGQYDAASETRTYTKEVVKK